MQHFDVAVIGAGASGLVAAITAAQNGASCVLIERASDVGRSILATGNGRCNFAHADLNPSNYNDPAFVSSVMGDAPLRRILDFFESIGLWYETDQDGRMFPQSRSALSVVEALIHAQRHSGVVLQCGAEVDAITHTDDVWRLRLVDGRDIYAKAVIWAAGGKSSLIPARDVSIPTSALKDALCPIATSPKPPRYLDGTRVRCELTLYRAGSSLLSLHGEVLWRRYGISGICVFDLSRIAEAGDEIFIDLVPHVSDDALYQLLQRRVDIDPEAVLLGTVHPKLARYLLEITCNGSHACVDAQRLAYTMKHLSYRVTGLADTSHAQVTQGGLENSSFIPTTLSLRTAQGFFACGEVLDVDGACGGFNLAWAWSSGLIAGAGAADYLRLSSDTQ